MKNKSVSQSILTGLFVVLVLAASNSIVRAQDCPGTTTWILEPPGTGDWFVAGNWHNCVPSATIDASINNGGTAQILGGDAMAESLTLGDNQGQAGLVEVGGVSAVLDVGTASCRGNIYIGNRGSGNLTIGNGGLIRSRNAYIAAVANPTRPASKGYVKVASQGFSGIAWYLEDNGPQCTGAALFIGCTADSNGFGGTATVDLLNYSTIKIGNYADAPGVIVGRSGTLTGNGVVSLRQGTSLSQTAQVFGTLAPAGVLRIAGNLTLDPNTASTVCHVTPTNADIVSVTAGGVATLGGRLTVIMTGTFTVGMSFTLLHADGGRGLTRFAFESIMLMSGGGPCISPVIHYDDDPDTGATDVNLRIESCVSVGNEDP